MHVVQMPSLFVSEPLVLSSNMVLALQDCNLAVRDARHKHNRYRLPAGIILLDGVQLEIRSGAAVSFNDSSIRPDIDRFEDAPIVPNGFEQFGYAGLIKDELLKFILANLPVLRHSLHGMSDAWIGSVQLHVF